jgi:uncharacterized phage-associated protein
MVSRLLTGVRRSVFEEPDLMQIATKAKSVQQVRAPYDARGVANFFLDLADQNRTDLTQMAVLKLLYFAQGWHLAKSNTPLVLQDFEAWQFGPVIKIVRDEFAKFGDGAIRGRATRFDLIKGQRSVVAPTLAEEDQTFVTSIFSAYVGFDAWQLSELTHEAGSPWDRMWNSNVPIGRLGLRIRNEDIRDHFAGISQRFKPC